MCFLGISVLQPGCRVWYFIYPLNYKYHGGKLIKRVTKEGYWKPTGRPRKVMASDTKTEIGSKRSLVFHKGRPKGKKTNTKSDKNKTKHENNRDKTKHGSNNRNKAVWVMHEYQLNTATPPNQACSYMLPHVLQYLFTVSSSLMQNSFLFLLLNCEILS